MPNRITTEDVLGAPPAIAAQSNNLPPITAQEIIDATPVRPAMQPQLVDEQGNQVSPIDIDNANSPSQIPQVHLEQRATGPDANVLPGNSGFAANLKAGMVEDPRAQIAQHAKALFPNDPNAAQRFGVRDGKIVYIDDDLNVRDVDSSFAAGTGRALAYAPETLGGIAGSFATGNPVLGGAAGSAAGKGVKQIIAGTMLDDPQTMGGNAAGMAKEGALSLLAGGAAKGVGKLVNKGRVVDFTPAQAGAAAATRQATQQSTGITLDLAQASGDPVLMSLRKYAAKFPGESAAIFKALDELQTGQSADAMQRLIAAVSKAQSSEAAGKGGINAAEAAIRLARLNVSKQVKPLYDAAYAAVPEVTDQKIVGLLELGPFKKAMASAKELAALEGVDTSKNSLQLMDYVKRGLDDQISGAKAAGQNQLARALTAKRKEFVDALDALPNQAWQAARQKYGELAKSQIEPLENGAIGVLSKIKDQKAATAAAKIFTDPNITAREIAFARSQIERIDPEAWRGLTAQYLGQALNKALKVTQRGEATNLAGKLYQSLAGTPEQAAKLRAALPANTQGMATEVINALKLVAATERAGSDTAFNQLITRRVEGRFATALKTLRAPVQTLIQAGEEKELESLVTRLATGLTDPANLKALRQVSKASPGLNRALQLLSIVGVGTGGRVAEGEINPRADMPIPALEPQRGARRPQSSPARP